MLRVARASNALLMNVDGTIANEPMGNFIQKLLEGSSGDTVFVRGFDRTTVAAFVAAGIVVCTLSSLWDLILQRPLHLGGKQVYGILVGLGLIGIGIALSPQAVGVRTWLPKVRICGLPAARWVAIFLLLLVATVMSAVLPRQVLLLNAAWIFFAYVIAGSFLLPRRLWGLSMLLFFGINLLLWVASNLKSDLTGLPLTALDIRFALSQPFSLWDVLDLPDWTYYSVVICGVVGAGILLWRTTVAIAEFANNYRPGSRLSIVVGRLSIGMGVLGLSILHFQHVHLNVSDVMDTWSPAGVAALFNEIGAIPFLTYSYRTERRNSGDFFQDGTDIAPPTDREVHAVLSKYVGLTDNTPAFAPNPNIILLMAESTFNPNRAFHLESDVNSELFSVNEYTAAVGPLAVNAVGGGTWITEFEVMLGVDARLFGHLGYYTHASLSPYVTASFVTYLRDKGYDTQAFFPHPGDFYNYRAAYQAYGFGKVFDDQQLGLDGWRATDVQLATRMVEMMEHARDAPLFAHLLLNENHGPHRCVDTSGVGGIRFAKTNDDNAHCMLAEYIRRLQSTSEAMLHVRKYLVELERETGRPFVLLVYGDHQPFSFTGTHAAEYDFDHLRTNEPKDLTFYHLQTSMPGRLNLPSELIPASLLPTLLSMFTTDNPSDVYLGINVWLYEHCGYNAIAMGPLTRITKSWNGKNGAQSRVSTVSGRSEVCEAAYRRALRLYRGANLFDFPNIANE
jgi:phosphoglycerol transferase MdoB-like AlkP superfamily enzyme